MFGSPGWSQKILSSCCIILCLSNRLRSKDQIKQERLDVGRRQFRFTERLTRNHEWAVLGFVVEAAMRSPYQRRVQRNDIHQGAESQLAHEQAPANSELR